MTKEKKETEGESCSIEGDKENCCPISKACKKLTLSCLLRKGAFIYFLLQIFWLVNSIKSLHSEQEELLSDPNFAEEAYTSSELNWEVATEVLYAVENAIFFPLVLLAAAKIIDLLTTKCSTKECS